MATPVHSVNCGEFHNTISVESAVLHHQNVANFEKQLKL